ncbi:hypothetical protein [Streptomyces sp. NBC_00562]|uniref:hypothetical protein n=1 Tax=Streptomyces sp. NBC_00562 TaxID=2975777 RepID=UPI003FCED72B
MKQGKFYRAHNAGFSPASLPGYPSTPNSASGRQWMQARIPSARAARACSRTPAAGAAVRPEALQGALATSATLAVGATGLCPTIQAFADIKPKRTHDKWYYVWVLQKKAAR